MLSEYKRVKQVSGEPYRRWFSDEILDLVIWLDNRNNIISFQLCYNSNDKAITWRKPSTYIHNDIDDGENVSGKHKLSPILIPDGKFDYEAIADCFRSRSGKMDKKISEFVYKKLLRYK